ncbi:MAG TPA: hypothetical protein DCZ12_02040, partial [Gammaproteobacteria bacterium]|nr:hypothetical protein [Gammaproteobacteria bacterium]
MATQYEERDRIYPRVNLREAARKDILDMPGKAVAAAPVIGLGGAQQVNNVTCDTKRDTHNMSLKQFEDLLEVFPCVNTAHAVAEIAGGFFVPGVEGEEVDGDVMAGTPDQCN